MDCQLKCIKCQTAVCIHQYICTCPDSLIQSTMCKHIHLLQCYIAKNKDGTTIEDGFNDNGSDFVTSEIDPVSSHLPQSNNAAHDTSMLTNTINEKLLKVGKQVELCTNKEALQQLDKQAKCSIALVLFSTKASVSSQAATNINHPIQQENPEAKQVSINQEGEKTDK